MISLPGTPKIAADDVEARLLAVETAGAPRIALRKKILRAGLVALLAAASAMLFLAAPAHGQSITATVTDSNESRGIAINPVTNKIYLADYGGNTITVIDGATNAISTITDPPYNGFTAENWAVAVDTVTNFVYFADQNSSTVDVFQGATATAPAKWVTSIPVGTSPSSPVAIAVNPATHWVYVADQGSKQVSVIDGSTNMPSKLTDISTGSIQPNSIAVNPATNMIYVTGSSLSDLLVIDGSTNAPATNFTPNPITVGSSPESIAINVSTNTIYVANEGSNNVSVVNGATGTVTATVHSAGMIHPVGLAVNPETNQVFVANWGNSGSNFVSVINGAANTSTDVLVTSGASVSASIAVDTTTDLAYYADQTSATVTVISGINLVATATLNAQANTVDIAVNPVTHKVYAVPFESGDPSVISVIDGATNTVGDDSPIDNLNTNPWAIAVDPVTNTLYVAENGSSTVSVIDGSSNRVTATASVGANPDAIVVDPINGLVYVSNSGDSTITAIDENNEYSTSTATITGPSGSITPNLLAFNPLQNIVFGASTNSQVGFSFPGGSEPPSISASTFFAGNVPVAIGTNPAQGYNYAVFSDNGSIQVSDVHGGSGFGACPNGTTPTAADVNPVTNTIYVACGGTSGVVSAIQGADSFTPGSTLTITPSFFSNPTAIAVNPVTNMTYALDAATANLYVINGSNNAIATTVSLGSIVFESIYDCGDPVSMALNLASNKIYVLCAGDSNDPPFVAGIDGATNTVVATIGVGTYPNINTLNNEVAANPVTGSIYTIADGLDNATVFAENNIQSNAPTTTITPLPPNNITDVISPSFTFNTSVSATGVYFQVDSQQGEWTAAPAVPDENQEVFTGTASNLAPGFHILYAYATNGQDATSANSGPNSDQDSPIVGKIAYYGFLVGPPIATINALPLDFGSVPIGGTSGNPNPILINEGFATMSYSYTITGPNADEFVVDPTQSCASSGTLASNAICGIYVTFQPTTTGPATATLTWTDNSLGVSGSTQSVGFTANGLPATASAFSNLTASQIIPVGTASINLSGTISASGNFPPTSNPTEYVTITIDGIQQTAQIVANGNFSTTFNTSTIPASATPYTITYSYPGDPNFSTASDSSTTLTVTSLSNYTLSVTEFGTGTGGVTDGTTALDCTETNGNMFPPCSKGYAGDTPVTLTEIPTPPSTFAGWGGACAGTLVTSTTCTVTMTSNLNVTANFIPPPQSIVLTFPMGANPPPQEAIFACPDGGNPCTDGNAHALQLSVPNVSATEGFSVTVTATEVPPTMADGLCEVNTAPFDNVSGDFDCRLVTFFGDGTDSHGNTIVPLCWPYANGNCVHYEVNNGTQGDEPDSSMYTGPVSWQITWNNDSFTPAVGSFWAGSTPQLYDDPDGLPTGTPGAIGTTCGVAMQNNLGGPSPAETYSCQFEFDITTFFNPTQPVDSGIGGSTKQFNDVVVAFPPTVTGSGMVTQGPLAPVAPTAISATCIAGCTASGDPTITFTPGTPTTVQMTSVSFPPSTLSVSSTTLSTLQSLGLTLNPLTGILSGTPSLTSSSSTVSFTATNSVGSTTQMFTLSVSSVVTPTSISISAPTVTYSAAGVVQVTVSAVSGTPTGNASLSVDGGTPLSAPLNGSGVATFTINGLSATTHSLNASYAAQGNFAASGPVAGSLVVSPAATSISISAPTVNYSANASIQVTVSSSAGTPTGSVSLTVNSGTPMSGTLSGGVETFTLTNPSQGTYSLSASYLAQGNFAASGPTAGSLVVSPAATSISISAPTVNYSANASIKVTVSSSAGTPTGSVSLTVNGGTPMSGTLSGGVATFTLTSPSQGTYSLSASYAAQGNFAAVGPATGSLLVSPAATSISISAPTVTYPAAGVVKVTVTSTGGTPAGSASLTVNSGTPMSGTLSGGVATFTLASPSPGTYNLSASYAAQGNFAASGPVTGTLTVNAAGSTLKFSPAILGFGTVYVGQTVVQATTVTNTGSSMVTFTSFSVMAISGDDSTGFLGVELCPKTLNAGKSCPIIMSFTADSNATKTHAANLLIADNASGSPQTVPMTATVINPQVSLSASSVNFGTQKTGTTSAAKKITLTNSGTTQLNLSGLTISSNFATATGTTCTKTTTLSAGTSCVINVTFTPTSKGSKSGSLVITDNARSSSQSVSLSGTGD